MCYILQPDWSLLLLKVVYTVNKETYRKHHFTTSCQHMENNTHLLLQTQGSSGEYKLSRVACLGSFRR